MKVVFCDNNRDYKRDYSDFIESCDIVVRANKMCSLNTGCVGERTDILMLSFYSYYLQYFSPEERHVAQLKEVPLIWFEGWTDIPKERVEFIKSLKHRSAVITTPLKPHFSTIVRALDLLTPMYPGAEFYFVGDLDVFTRTSNPWHVKEGEDEYLKERVEAGTLIECYADPDRYSHPINEETEARKERVLRKTKGLPA